jgi:single-stranded-DNA-specific exonuclease
MSKKWKIQPRTETDLLNQLLVNRSISSEAAEGFLRPMLANLLHPHGISNMAKAANRIYASVRAGQKIVLYGDYDVDGITGTATLLRVIRYLGGNVDFYIPNRVDEGYGLHDESINAIIDAGAWLIVSIDCGITAVSPAMIAAARGIDLIITDHHQWKDELPECFCIVHPSLCEGTSRYENPHLCGAGVAFKLAWALGLAASKGPLVSHGYSKLLRDLLALTALGTIADVVPLIGENRVIVKHGLHMLPSTPIRGLSALMESAKLDPQKVDSGNVGFQLSPRLNAAGRLGHAGLAVNLFMETEPAKALVLAQTLTEMNERRKVEEKRVVGEAEEIVLTLGGAENPTDILVVVGPKTWHPGVVGIVAARLAETHERPAIVLVEGTESAGGSGRTFGGFDLTAAIGTCAELVTSYGGHAAACGLKLPVDNVGAFRRAMCGEYQRHLKTSVGIAAELVIDAELVPDDLTVSTVLDLEALGPHGAGNARPLFCLRGITVDGKRSIGKKGEYIVFNGIAGTKTERIIKCLCFRSACQMASIPDGTVIDAVGELSLDKYGGSESVSFFVREVRVREQDSMFQNPKIS